MGGISNPASDSIMWNTMPVSGFYSPSNTLLPQSSSINIVVDTILLLPYSKLATIDQLAVECTTLGAAGSNIILGIYNSDPVTRKPTTIIQQSGSISLTTTGIKSFNITPLAVTNLKWLAMIMQGTLAQLRQGNNFLYGGGQFFGYANFSANAPVNITQAQAYGALPANFNTTYPAATVGYSPIHMMARIV